jgi:hypothetical protein
MVGVAIILCLILGGTLACAAAKFPSHVVALERCGGALLVVSLALLGGSLHYFGEAQLQKFVGGVPYMLARVH